MDMRSVIAFISVLGLFLCGTVFAQQTATPEQQAILRQFGINSNLVDGNVVQRLTGGCAQNPYPILEQFKSGSNVNITPQAGAQSGTASASGFQAGINSVLACRLSQFLVYAQQTKGCKFTISSAYRSAQLQAQICGSGGPNCGAPGRSCHQYGLAVDLTSSASCMQWAKQFLGSKNPGSQGAQQFKLHWPITSDDGHTQCIENTVGNCSPSTQACDGSGNSITPNNSYTPVMSQSPLGALNNGLGSFLAPPMPQQCPQGYMMMNGTCLPPQAAQMQQTSNPYSYLSPPPPPPTSSYLPNTGGTGTTGSTNTTNPNGTTPIDLNNGNSNVNISDIINGNGSSAGTGGQTGSSTSAIDLINQIANPTSTDDGVPQTQTPTGTPVTLVSSLNDSVTLHGSSTSLHPSWQSSSTYTLSQGVSQTFVSQDLSQTPASLQPMRPVSSTFAVLENIKQTLLQILAYLKPFGGTVPRATTVNNTTTAYME